MQNLLCTLSSLPTVDNNTNSIVYHYRNISSAVMEMCMAPEMDNSPRELLGDVLSKPRDSEEPPRVPTPNPYTVAPSARATYAESQDSLSEESPANRRHHCRPSSHEGPTDTEHHPSQASIQVPSPEPESPPLHKSKTLNKDYPQPPTRILCNGVHYTSEAPARNSNEALRQSPKTKPLEFSNIISISTTPLAIPHSDCQLNGASRPHRQLTMPSLGVRFEQNSTKPAVSRGDGISMHVEPSEDVEISRSPWKPVPRKVSRHRPFGAISSCCSRVRLGTPLTMEHVHSGSCHLMESPVAENGHGVSGDPQPTGIYCLESHR